MKLLLTLITFLGLFKSYGQKIFLDKKDPFTNERRIQTSNSNITPILQAGGMVIVKDSSKTFFLSFIVPALPVTKIETVDSLKKECKIKTSAGTIITGEWYGNAQLPIGPKFYNSFTYSFTQADFNEMATANITDIKTDQGLFEIDPKNVGKLSKLCGLLLSKI